MLSKPKYSLAQREKAVGYYFDHGRCIASTIKALRYPARDSLRAWIHDLHPELHTRVAGRSDGIARPPTMKRAAVIALYTRQESAKAVAQKLGLTVAMLFAGGVTTMEYATLIFTLPVTIIAYLVMASFYKVLRMERAEREGQVLRRLSMAPIGGHVPERSWEQQLEQLRAYPSLHQVTQFLGNTVQPALDELAAEFRNQRYNVEREAITNASGTEEPLLRVSMDTFRDFHYHVAIVEAPVPMFSGRMSRETDVYYRLEVYT